MFLILFVALGLAHAQFNETAEITTRGGKGT